MGLKGLALSDIEDDTWPCDRDAAMRDATPTFIETRKPTAIIGRLAEDGLEAIPRKTTNAIVAHDQQRF
jgi:hypothetical protein